MENETYYYSFYVYLLDKGYLFDKETIENYLLSLKVKPFAILTGNSGTGKTKLSQLYAKYISGIEENDVEDEDEEFDDFDTEPTDEDLDYEEEYGLDDNYEDAYERGEE